MANPNEGGHSPRLPYFNGFRPLGLQKTRRVDGIIISYKEYEVLMLCDSECISEKDAAHILHVSHRYLHKIHRSLMKKIAKAFIEGREIYFGESNINIPNWYECKHCGISFTITSASGTICPFCKTELLRLKQ